MSNKMFIYTLSDPEEPEHIRYVGMTTEPDRRIREHINKSHRQLYSSTWIRTLLSDEVEPVMSIIEEVPAEEGPEREIFWIAHYKEEGHRLTNLTDGGESTLGYRHTEKSLNLMRKNRKGKCAGEDHWLYGKKMSEESRRKMSEAKKGIVPWNKGGTFSEESRKKMSESQKKAYKKRDDTHWIEYKGKKRLMREVYEETGCTLNYVTFSDRIHRGWDVDKALAKPPKDPNRYVTLHGMQMPLKEACMKLGVSYQMVKKRISSYGWDEQEALFTPAGATRKGGRYTKKEKRKELAQKARSSRVIRFVPKPKTRKPLGE